MQGKFNDALDLSPRKAKLALNYIQKLYAIEKKSKNLSPDERNQLRQKDAIPILTAFYAWLEKAVLNLLPKSLMEKRSLCTQTIALS